MSNPPKEWCPFATMELAKCQKSFNELQDKYNKLFSLVKDRADNGLFSVHMACREILKQMEKL